MAHRHAVRLTARILIFGAWSTAFVLAILFIASRGLSAVAGAPGTATGAGTAGPMQQLLADRLLLYSIGIGAFGTGILLLAIGWDFFTTAIPDDQS